MSSSSDPGDARSIEGGRPGPIGYDPDVPAHVVLYVKDLERMRSFYGGGLGLELLEAAGGYAVLASPVVDLALVVVPEATAARIAITVPPARRAEVPVKLGFPVARA